LVWFCGVADNVYTYQFTALISHNDTLPQRYQYGGYRYIYSYVSSSGVATQNWTLYRSSSSSMLPVGRFVTVVPFTSVLSICEVTVIGVLQNISADGNQYNNRLYIILCHVVFLQRCQFCFT